MKNQLAVAIAAAAAHDETALKAQLAAAAANEARRERLAADAASAQATAELASSSPPPPPPTMSGGGPPPPSSTRTGSGASGDRHAHLDRTRRPVTAARAVAPRHTARRRRRRRQRFAQAGGGRATMQQRIEQGLVAGATPRELREALGNLSSDNASPGRASPNATGCRAAACCDRDRGEAARGAAIADVAASVSEGGARRRSGGRAQRVAAEAGPGWPSSSLR